MSQSSGYRRLNYHYRIWLSMLLKKNYSFRKAGREMKKHHTVLIREVHRNGTFHKGKWEYDPILAQQKYKQRLGKSRKYKIVTNRMLYYIIKLRLLQGWSPDSISGFLKINKSSLYVSHETIYKYIYTHKHEWIKYLARGHRKRYKRTGKYGNRRKNKIPKRVSIEKRPYFVGLRNVFGHFEVDCMVSRLSHGAILVILERKTRMVKLIKLPRKTAKNVKRGIIKTLLKYQIAVKTITYDNGLENVLHHEVNEELGCKSYFCNPYHSWEKGSVENVIGLVRRYIPKGTDLEKISKNDLRKIEKMINNKPRKILGYKSSKDRFNVEWCKLN